MANRKLECPHCEAGFELIEPSLINKIKCASCNKVFLLSEAIDVLAPPAEQPPITPLSPQPLSPQPMLGLESVVSLDKAALGIGRQGKPSSKWRTDDPKVPATSVSIRSNFVRPSESSIPPNDSDASTSGVPSEARSELEIVNYSKTIISELARNRRKKQLSTFMISNSLMLLAILGGIIWLFFRFNAEPFPKQTLPEQSVPVLFDPNRDRGQSSLKEDPGSKDNSESGENSTSEPVKTSRPMETESSQQKLPAAPPPKPTFAFHSSKQVAEIWKLAKPNMVLLDIEGPLGKLKGVGTIVDSRGWILTSHQAVKDAWKIEVTASLNPLDQKTIEPPLQDLVRGHVISDPENDLAILAVNLRFVVSLAELRRAEHDRIVPEIRLVAANPPNESFYYGVSETKIEKRGPISELPMEAKRKLESLKLGADDKLWFQVLCPNELLPGTPLFDADGRYQLMVSFSKQKFGYAVAVDKVAALLKRATGNISPLKPQGLKTDSGDVVVIGSEHPVRQRMTRLSKWGTNCDDFDFIPTNSEQFSELTEFLTEYQSARRYLKSKERDYRDAPENLAADDALLDLLKEWEQKVNASLQDLQLPGDQRVREFNSFAKESLGQSSTQIPLLVRVNDGTFMMEEFRVEVLETDFVLSIPHSSSGRRLMPGTFWLLMVETGKENNEKKFNHQDGKPKTLISVDLRAQFGPIEEK